MNPRNPLITDGGESVGIRFSMTFSEQRLRQKFQPVLDTGFQESPYHVDRTLENLGGTLL